MQEQQQQPQQGSVNIQGPQAYHKPPATLLRKGYYPNYKWRNSHIVGIIHIIIGIICIALGGVLRGGMCYYAFARKIGHGIWGGVLFVITGVIALVASKAREYRTISLHSHVATASMVVAVICFILSLIGVFADYHNCYSHTIVILDGTMCGLFALEIAMTIWSVVIGSVARTGNCCGGCCTCYLCDECYGEEHTMYTQVSTADAGVTHHVPMQPPPGNGRDDEDLPPKYESEKRCNLTA
ncbi:hypothetical protein CAPTEDRAFT_225795 [Capitella teleta]|uniref:Uncharacterized protein n=1 Tax=Capitella teleta TaxID=283909 RepID=R7UPB5_CAPTE|nr:hypothetical protein CAPTEDRAFT_225795 [Capitella teleta]|eukprot:ELU07948.1 hypothetical protein CAPTEDRAFT_225795 [Capitella teleta]